MIPQCQGPGLLGPVMLNEVDLTRRRPVGDPKSRRPAASASTLTPNDVKHRFVAMNAYLYRLCLCLRLRLCLRLCLCLCLFSQGFEVQRLGELVELLAVVVFQFPPDRRATVEIVAVQGRQRAKEN